MGNITDFLVANPNLPFLIAGCVVVGLFILESVLMTIGHSTMLTHGDVDFSLDLDGNGIPDYLEHGGLHFGDVLNPGHIPATMFLVVFCGAFSLLGYTGQWIYLGATGGLAPMLLSLPITLVPTLAVSRWTSVGMAKIMPQDETNAIALESLAGDAGILTAGPVSGLNDFGMARFTDKYGTDHHLMVGGATNDVIESGSNVVLVGPHPDKAIAFIVRKI